MNLREPRNERKKNDQRLRNTADKKKKNIKWRIQSAHQAVVSRATSRGITVQQTRYCLEIRENLQKGEK